MTTITLPPDLEAQIAIRARQRGTTPELLAIDGLRHLFATPPTDDTASGRGTLFEYLGDSLGAVDGTADSLSEDCGRRFADGLIERQRQAQS